MSWIALIVFDETDRTVAESVRSFLAENRVQARLAETAADLRAADVAVAVLSPAGAGSAQMRGLLEEAFSNGMEVVALRLERTPLPFWYWSLGPARGFVEAPSPPDRRSLLRLLERLLEDQKPTRGGFRGTYAIPGDGLASEPPPTRGGPKGDRDVPVRPVRSPEFPGATAPGPAPAAAQPLREGVDFSAWAPPVVQPATQFLLSIWAFLKQDREEVRERASRGGLYQEAGSKGPILLARGTEVTVVLDLPGFTVDSPAETLFWDGGISNCDFWVTAPPGMAAGQYPANVRLLVGAVQVGQLRFGLTVGGAAAEKAELSSNLRWIRTMFASYASKDRPDVLRFVQGAEAVGVEVFVDVVKLRTGEDWEARLRNEVATKDLFCLFWSKSAKRSKWVRMEWEAAYAAKGPDYIYPVPLALPGEVPPPRKLRNKHFNSLLQILIDQEQRKRAAS